MSMALARWSCAAASGVYARGPESPLPCATPVAAVAGSSAFERFSFPTWRGGGSACPPSRLKSGHSRITCQASEKESAALIGKPRPERCETVAKARRFQLEATDLLAELLKAKDVKTVAESHVELLSEDFFIIASTYLDLAKKEGNLEVVTKIENTLQTALQVKEATLRPEIRLLNQLLRETSEKDRANTIQAHTEILAPDSYFFQLLSRMISDVENQKSNPNRLRLLTQLRMINKETREVAKVLKRKSN